MRLASDRLAQGLLLPFFVMMDVVARVVIRLRILPWRIGPGPEVFLLALAFFIGGS